MMTLSDLSSSQLQGKLEDGRVRFRVGPYVYSIESRLPIISEGLKVLYGDFPVEEPGGFCDFHLKIGSNTRLDRWRRRVDFYLDKQRPFSRLKRRHAWAFLEWGMNWCVSVCTNEYLKLHAAVVAKDGVALIMPGLPGAGKSTLCAALALNGWRVLSDEHALISPGTSDIVPLYRPVSLKNESIKVIRDLGQGVVFGPRTDDTHKGSVVHMKADFSPESHDLASIPARLMIFPQFTAGAPLSISTRSRPESLMFAGHHAFNYGTLSEAGFHTMTTLMDDVQCYNLQYSDLPAALDAINELHAQVCAA